MFNIKNYNSNDTIAAIATFPSKSALGVIKISGKKALPIISKLFKPSKAKDIKKVKTYTLHYGWIIKKSKKSKRKRQNENILDEVLVSIMRGPNTYTREDVVEISTHGGSLVLGKILELVLAHGARQAMPGEFSWRAFTKGRVDLLQLQGISDIVDAKNNQSLLFANLAIKGQMTKSIFAIKEKIKEILIILEAAISFPEDQISFSQKNILDKLEKIEKEINVILEESKRARILKEGVRCVICGKANAGKSTLFNRLLKEERVIVTKIAGTTRDVVCETINIKGIPIKIYDTAGILEPKDLIEKKALQAARRTLDEANLILWLLDFSKKLTREDLFLLERIKNRDIICVVNKSDLSRRIDLDFLKKLKKPQVLLSALCDKNLSSLEEVIFKTVYKNGLSINGDIILSSQWQIDILDKTKDKLQEAENFIKKGYTLDFVNFSIKDVLDNLGKLTGEVLSQEILDNIFDNFCIGK